MANTSDVNQRSADVVFRASIEDFAVEFSVESVAEILVLMRKALISVKLFSKNIVTNAVPSLIV